MQSFLKTINKSHMPVIHTFELKISENKQLPMNELLLFIESKKTLKSLLLYFQNGVKFELIEFFRNIIEILKEPCTPKRPFLVLNTWYVQLGVEVVSKITL